MKSQENMNLSAKAQKYLINTYAKYPLEIVKGSGSFVWDNNGKKYLDFYGGHAVCLLGHCHPKIGKALNDQSKKLMFYSNIFDMEPAILLAEQLAKTLVPEHYQIYFTNSGSEANEAALKIARKHTGKKHIIAFKNSFHGRGISALAVTGISSYHQFIPNLDDYTSFAELGNVGSVKKAYNKDTAAIICEPIQSIGGMNMVKVEFYQDLEKFCAQKKILLIFDEVQTGLGRTGTFWFSQSLGIAPDIITTAKGLAGGLPLAAVLVKKEVSSQIQVGDHATTFGGGPVPCAAALATLAVLQSKNFLMAVKQKEKLIKQSLKNCHSIKTIKGKGLLLGIELKILVPNLVKKCLDAGLIIGSSSNPKVFRIMPPLTISKKEIQLFSKIFTHVISQP